MQQDILPALVNGVAVGGGLFVLWSFVGGMRHASAAARARAAVFAGAVSVVITVVATAAIRALT